MFTYLAENYDLPILDWIAEHLQCGFLDWFMPKITMLGEAGIFFIVMSVLLLIFPKTRKMGLACGIALIFGLLVCNLGLKPLAARIRPYDYQLANYGREISLLVSALSDYSFPSGHTIAAFEFAAACICFRKKIGIAAFVLAVVIAFSRLYLYVHYPTDVLVSVVLGTLFGILGGVISKKLATKFPKLLPG